MIMEKSDTRNTKFLELIHVSIHELALLNNYEKKEKDISEEDETNSSRSSQEGLSSGACVTESASNVVKPFKSATCNSIGLRSRFLTKAKRRNSVATIPFSPPRVSRLRKTHPMQARKALKTEHPSGVKKPTKQAKTSVNKQKSLKERHSKRGVKSVITKGKSKVSPLPPLIPPSTNRSGHPMKCVGNNGFSMSTLILENSTDLKIKPHDEEILQVEIAPIPIDISKCTYKKRGKKKLTQSNDGRLSDSDDDLMVIKWNSNVMHNYAAKNEERKNKFIEDGKKHKEEALCEAVAQHLKYKINNNEQNNHQGECREHIKCGSCCLPRELYFPSSAFPYIQNSDWPYCAEIQEIGTESSTCISSIQSSSHSDAKREAKSSPVSEPSRKKLRVLEVLECVKNVSDVSIATVRVPNLSGSSEHTKENAEIGEEKRALEFLSKLQSKKKKKNQEPVRCEICDKTFTAHATLVHHYRGHAKIKLYRCDKCDVTFTRKHSLNYHLSIHDNKCRFQCQACGKPFRHPSHFREHIRRHTGETPFQCDICLQKFRTRNSFKRHMKIMHKKKLTNRGLEDIPEIIKSET